MTVFGYYIFGIYVGPNAITNCAGLRRDSVRYLKLFSSPKKLVLGQMEHSLGRVSLGQSL